MVKQDQDKSAKRCPKCGEPATKGRVEAVKDSRGKELPPNANEDFYFCQNKECANYNREV